MTAAERLDPLDWQAYLDGEELATRKHEYVYGRVYAMAGAKNLHNVISGNILIALGGRLKGSPCRASGSDQKVRIRTKDGVCFFYPDVTVDCEPLKPDLVYTDTPKIVVEVLSPSTRRVDEGEKCELYLKIPSLTAYILVDSERLGAVVLRRSGAEFKREIHVEPSGSIPLPEIGASLPLPEVYANVVWSKAKSEDDASDES